LHHCNQPFLAFILIQCSSLVSTAIFLLPSDRAILRRIEQSAGAAHVLAGSEIAALIVERYDCAQTSCRFSAAWSSVLHFCQRFCGSRFLFLTFSPAMGQCVKRSYGFNVKPSADATTAAAAAEMPNRLPSPCDSSRCHRDAAPFASCVQVFGGSVEEDRHPFLVHEDPQKTCFVYSRLYRMIFSVTPLFARTQLQRTSSDSLRVPHFHATELQKMHSNRVESLRTCRFV
jgi:hypothetical protein